MKAIALLLQCDQFGEFLGKCMLSRHAVIIAGLPPNRGGCSRRSELRQQLNDEHDRSQLLLSQEAQARQHVEQESAATKVAVEEAITDLEALDAERSELRSKLQVCRFSMRRWLGLRLLSCASPF